MDHGHLDDEENTVDIVVTAPSSPEAQTNRATSEYDDNGDYPELTFIPLDSLSVPATMSESAQQALPRTAFEDALANASLPEPGPAHFAARREIWTTPRSSQPAQPRQPSKRSQKFQAMLQSEGPLDDVYWNAGLDKIWKGLISGQRVREPLALRELIKILQAGWMRDGTWPKGQFAPEPDDEIKVNESPLSPTTTTEASRLATPSTLGTSGIPLDEGLQERLAKLSGIPGPSR